MDGWMDGCVCVCMCGVDGWTNGWDGVGIYHVCMCGVDGWTNGWDGVGIYHVCICVDGRVQVPPAAYVGIACRYRYVSKTAYIPRNFTVWLAGTFQQFIFIMSDAEPLGMLEWPLDCYLLCHDPPHCKPHQVRPGRGTLSQDPSVGCGGLTPPHLPQPHLNTPHTTTHSYFIPPPPLLDGAHSLLWSPRDLNEVICNM